jgi:hypothetical protein
MSRPSKTTLPLVGSSSRIITRASVDFPQPDSPTIPSVSPRRTCSETPSSALTEATSCLNTMPSVIGSASSPRRPRAGRRSCRLRIQAELRDDARRLLELARSARKHASRWSWSKPAGVASGISLLQRSNANRSAAGTGSRRAAEERGGLAPDLRQPLELDVESR